MVIVNNDNNIEEERKRNPKRNVVIVTLRNKDNLILMVRTKKLPNSWQPIGGGIDEGETPIDAIIRELYEETGIKISCNDLIEVTRVPYDFGEGTVYCYDTKTTFEEDLVKIEKEEIEEYRWFSLEEMTKLPMFKATASFIEYLMNKNK